MILSQLRFLIRDRNGLYDDEVIETIKALGIEQKLIAYESPWQYGYVERVCHWRPNTPH